MPPHAPKSPPNAPNRPPTPPQGQFLTVEQLTLDFEYVINEVIRNDAAWAPQFCSFSDYDVVILEVGGVGCGEGERDPPRTPPRTRCRHFDPPPPPQTQVCPDTNQVLINIGLLLLAFPAPDEEGLLR